MFALLICAAALVSTTFLMMSFISRRNEFEVAGATAIVTGGSQGLGLSIAKQLSAKGANVVIIAQTVSKLERAIKDVESCASRDGQRFLFLSYDLRSPDSAPAIIEKVKQWNGSPPDIVFNCAGNCIPGFFATSDIDTHRVQMDTIYWTCAYLAHATLKEWTTPSKKPPSKRTRHLIFTSSTLAFFPLAGYGSYSPAKAAMRALADTLNQEIEVYNGARANGNEAGPEAVMKMHIAFPMGITSPGYENEQKTKPRLTKMLEENDTPQEPDVVAKIILSGLEAGHFTLTTSFVGNVMRGWAIGASQRTSLLDYLWGWLGSIIVLFIIPDYLAKCRKWGREKGLSAAK